MDLIASSTPTCTLWGTRYPYDSQIATRLLLNNVKCNHSTPQSIFFNNSSQSNMYHSEDVNRQPSQQVYMVKRDSTLDNR